MENQSSSTKNRRRNRNRNRNRNRRFKLPEHLTRPIDKFCFRNDSDSSITFLDDHKSNWFSTTESIDFKNQLCSSKFTNLLKNPPNNFLSLKYLRIWYLDSRFELKLFNLSDLNQFRELEILEIYGLEIFAPYSLCLPNLTGLSFAKSLVKRDNFFEKIIINTPRLHSLRAFAHDLDKQIEFTHPQSIKYLRTDYLEGRYPFSNLECLEVMGLITTIDDLLPHYTKLKRLKLSFVTIDKYLYPVVQVNREDLEHLLDTRNDLEFFVHGVKISNISKYDEFNNKDGRLEDHNLRFQLNNYGELEDDLHFVKKMYYNNTLIDLLPNQPADLFRKYTNIQQIRIYGRIEDENRLINFIKECPNLYNLYIEESSLSQQFYDQLPAISSLIKLEMVFIKDINFKFVQKMSYLVELITEKNCLKDVNLNNLRYLKRCIFYIKAAIDINKKGQNNYNIDFPEDSFYPKIFNLNCLNYKDLIGTVEDIGKLSTRLINGWKSKDIDFTEFKYVRL